jgi:DNA-binding transcriptional ArsR family regulator
MDKLEHAFDAVAAYFSVLSEPTRLRIMHAICEEEKAVSQIVEELGATQTNISRHLNLMHRGGVLARRREGNQVYYRAADAEMVEICRSMCNRIAAQINETKPLRGDLLRLLPRTKSNRNKRAA